MKTNTKINSVIKLSSLSILCALLTACGSGSGDDADNDDNDIDLTPTQPVGVQLDSSNYQASFQTAGFDTAEMLTDLMGAGGEIVIDDLSIINITGASVTRRCDNTDGTLQRTDLGSNTIEYVFDDCNIASSDTRYHGIWTIKTDVTSGSAANLGDYDFDWNFARTMTFNDFSQTKPVTGGVLTVANGEVVNTSTNNVAGALDTETVSSSNLTIATADASGISTIRQFSDLFYDVLYDDSDDEGISEVDLDFVGNITGLGDITLTTATVLETDFDDRLQTGSTTLSTGASLVKLEGTGNDNVVVSIDSDNDGLFEDSLLTTWDILSGPDDGV